VLILRALDDARKGSWHVLLADRAKRRPAAVSLRSCCGVSEVSDQQLV
jgi:hypothetical protein